MHTQLQTSKVGLRAKAHLLLTLTALLSFVLTSYAQRAVWCGKPAGLLERNYTYEASGSAISLSQSLAGKNETFLYIRRTSTEAQARAAAASMLPVAMAMDSKSKKVPELTTQQIEEQMRNPVLQADLDKFIDAFKNAKPESNWYFYSNSALLSDFFSKKRKMQLEESSKGALLLMDAEGERRILPQAVGQLVNYIQPKLVLIDGPIPSELELSRYTDSPPLILKLQNAAHQQTDKVSKAIDVVSDLRNATPQDTTVIFLMPEVKDDAVAWGFSEEKATQYATNGKRIMRDLDKYGFQESTTKAKTRQSAIDAIKSASGQGKRLIVVVGEASDNGSVRVPGSLDLLRPEDLSLSTNNSTLLGLVCNSDKLVAAGNGLGVVGTVYTDQIRAVARVFFDKREQDSMQEYLDVPYSPLAQTKNRAADALGSIAAYMSQGIDGSRVLPALFTVIAATPSPTPTPAASASSSANSNPTGPNQGNPSDSDASTLLIFLAGVVGSVGREVVRWRRLSNRKRADLFRKPQYLLVSAIQIVLGGAAALIFGHLVSGNWSYAVGFVSGAGLEELVRRAMLLEIWTPSVPHGPGTGRDDSVLEYLRA